jgi:hypothetical protein
MLENKAYRTVNQKDVFRPPWEGCQSGPEKKPVLHVEQVLSEARTR